jgi:ribosomal protein S18 acetylase RimI-like enzyme
MNDDLARAFAAMRATEFRGTREEPFRFGTVAFTPEVPLKHDANFLFADRLEPETSADELAAEADRLQRGAGLGHRMVVVPGTPGERLEPGFRTLGWAVHRHLVMVLRHEPARTADTTAVVEVDLETLRPLREAVTLGEPWGTPEVARQLVDGKRLVLGTTRYLAVLDDGKPVSCTDLYLSGETAQIEDLVTLEAHRRRGHATALVLHATAEAHRAGAAFVFLVADDEDWPKDLYERLGFESVGLYWKFVLAPAPAA